MAKRARKKMEARKRRAEPPPPPHRSRLEPIVMTVIVIALIVAASAYLVLREDGGDDGTGNGSGNGNNNPPNGDPAPPFLLTDIDGAPVSLEQLRGRVVLLDLFATWCQPCNDQMSELEKLTARYLPSQLAILSVDADYEETEEDVRAFRDRHGADWIFALDTDNVKSKYNFEAYPTLVIIDKEGNEVWHHVGAASFDVLVDILDPLM